MKAIIMAGGKGTRLAPLTNDIPKPLVKIIDKPVIVHIIELLRRHGITEIGVTLGYKAEKIIEALGDGSNLGVNLTYFIEGTPLGTAGSVKNTEGFVSDDFLVISGDAYTDLDITRLISYHLEKKSPLTLVATPWENPVGLGVLETDFDGRITSFIEKPTGLTRALINCGIYMLNKSTLDLIPDGPYDFGRELLPSMVKHIYAYVTYDYWSDIGTLPTYYMANYRVATRLSV